MNRDTDVSTALAGIRVVSTALNLPGPACTARLARLGAKVIKVEPPSGDPMAGYSRGYYDEMRRHVDVQALDLKSTGGRARFDALLASADILITAQRRSALQRLGLGWEDLSRQFRRLCHVAIEGDNHGENAGESAGHDLTYIVDAGLSTPPQLPRTLLADLAGAERAVQAAFTLLRLREQSGRGERTSVSLAEVARDFAAPLRHGLTQKSGTVGGGHPGYNFYMAKDGWIALAALEPHFVFRIQSLLGVTLTADALKLAFASQPRAHWQQWAREHDIPLTLLP
ncbi:MAG: CoA transferase [Betaproteobacteria bacterium]|nr:CoA transferase [Betaproteobacteria bacterium]